MDETRAFLRGGCSPVVSVEGYLPWDRRRLSQQLVLFASLGNASKPKIGRLPDLIINGRQIRELLWALQSIDWPLIHARTAGGWRLATFGLKFGRRASKFIWKASEEAEHPKHDTARPPTPLRQIESPDSPWIRLPCSDVDRSGPTPIPGRRGAHDWPPWVR